MGEVPLCANDPRIRRDDRFLRAHAHRSLGERHASAACCDTRSHHHSAGARETGALAVGPPSRAIPSWAFLGQFLGNPSGAIPVWGNPVFASRRIYARRARGDETLMRLFETF